MSRRVSTRISLLGEGGIEFTDQLTSSRTIAASQVHVIHRKNACEEWTRAFSKSTSGAEEEGSKLGRLGLKLKTRTSL